MDKIEKHLKAEGKIREVHDIIDEALDSDNTDGNNGAFFNWKNIGLILAFLIAGSGLWLWNASDQQSVEVTAPYIETSETPPIKTEKPSIEKEIEKAPPQNNKKEKPSTKKSPPVAQQEIDKPSDTQKPAIQEKTNTPQPERNLIAANFSPPKWGNNNMRSASETAPEDQKKIARQMYNSGAFNEVLKITNPLANKYPGDWEILFYNGVCQFKAPDTNTDDAIVVFKKIIENDDNVFIEDAEWMLAVALLSKGEQSAAKTILQQNILIYSTHKHYSSAKELFNELNE